MFEENKKKNVRSIYLIELNEEDLVLIFGVIFETRWVWFVFFRFI